MGLLDEFEKRMGLPPLKEILGEGGDKGRASRLVGLLRQLNPLMKRLENLSKDSHGMANTLELLRLVERLDQQGTLQRLDELLKDLQPLLKSKSATALLDRLDKLAPVLEGLLKE